MQIDVNHQRVNRRQNIFARNVKKNIFAQTALNFFTLVVVINKYEMENAAVIGHETYFILF